MGVVEHQVDDGDGARVKHHHGLGPRALAQAVAHGGPDRPASRAGHELQVVAVGVAHRVGVGEEACVGHQRGVSSSASATADASPARRGSRRVAMKRPASTMA